MWKSLWQRTLSKHLSAGVQFLIVKLLSWLVWYWWIANREEKCKMFALQARKVRIVELVALVFSKLLGWNMARSNCLYHDMLQERRLLFWHKNLKPCFVCLNGIILQAKTVQKRWSLANPPLVCHLRQWRQQWKRRRWRELEKVRPTFSGFLSISQLRECS